jgi:programmed cell death 6-interacting protein
MAPSPNHIMLAIHCKRTDQVELKAPILAYIRDTYSDREAEDAEDDLALVQSLRNDIVASQSGPQAAIKEQLTKCVVFFGWFAHAHNSL